MKISLIQRSIEWLDPTANRAEAEEWIQKSQGSSLVLLSEMFTTGFTTNPEQSAAEGDKTLEWLKEMAQRYDIAIGGSVATEQDGAYFNRFYIVQRDGTVEHYDKHHLFTFAGEHKAYSAGNERVIVTIEGVRVLLLVCYDLRFPVWIRNRGDYDIIACVAAWPAARRLAWDTLLRARAIENLCYVCAVNIIGSDPTCSYSGGTAAIDFLGNTIASAADNQSEVITVDVDLEALREGRERFTALNDADNFEIIQ